MASRWQKLARGILAPNAQAEVKSAWTLVKTITNKDEYCQAMETIMRERQKLKRPSPLHPSSISRLVSPMRTFKLDIFERRAFIDCISLLGPIPSKLMAELFFDQDDIELAASRLSPDDLGSNTVLHKVMSTGNAVDICEILGPKSILAPETFHMLMNELYLRKEFKYMADLWQNRHSLCPELKSGYTEALKHQLLVAAVESNDEKLLSMIPKPATLNQVGSLVLAEMLDIAGHYENIPAAFGVFPSLKYKDFPLIAERIAEKQTGSEILALAGHTQSGLLGNVILSGVYKLRDLKLLCDVYSYLKSAQTVPADLDTACLIARANSEFGRDLSALEIWTEFVVKRGVQPNQRFMELLIDSEVKKRELPSAILFLKEMRRRKIYVRQRILNYVQNKSAIQQSKNDTSISFALSATQPLLVAQQQLTGRKSASNWLDCCCDMPEAELREIIEDRLFPQ